jgi:hypothetical protein
MMAVPVVGGPPVTKAEPPKPSAVPRLIGIVAVLLVHFLTLLLLVVQSRLIVPKYAAFFEQANVELPAVTMQVMRLSRIFANYWHLAIILGMAADAAVVQHLGMPPSKSSWGLALYSHLWLLGVIALMFWVSIALYVPVFSMVLPDGPMFGPPT